MFFKAGLLSLLLLLASRALGVLRETALAAAFGSSGMADVVIVMLTLPDWLAGVVAGGALAYVLLPHWAQETPAQQQATQNRVARRLLWTAGWLAAGIGIAQVPLGALLMPGLPPALQGAAHQALLWSAVALPAAMLAGLWAARLQHERDVVGLYSANLLVNGVLIAALLLLGGTGAGVADGPGLGAFLLLAVVLRLLWQGWRLRHRGQRAQPPAPPASLAPAAPAIPAMPVAPVAPAPLPGWRVWLWAALGAGLPLTLPFVARTLASGAGEGALATFNYAWKLVELPLVLAIQLVAALAFPAIAQAHADGKDAHALARAVRSALVMAWTLACASAAALLAGAPVIARLLFGWGRMQAPALEQIAAWGSAGAWGLLPQALLAVALTVLATWGRMRFAVLAYALALALLLLAGVLGLTAGQQLMWALNAGFMVAALVAWSALGAVRHWVPLRTLLAPFAALLVVAWLVQWLGPADGIAPIVPIGHGRLRELVPQLLPQLLLCALAALAVIASGWFSGPHLRNALRS
ncbi:lipid II flippase MurJ [Verminephrobacter eiseniae]|uniref:Virulence factor MVIN family protein n=3 Tax=Verminephrobacter eiseniae TaxID=364317 RepID=A1WMC9_VEREI|nr:lipid II flippase MurJ [Verminephrobacter eiseniae]ABM58786.1 virulence factor MVIN family protein [Verminephrobacter eiseniae EF01-2]MCW5284355.1 hypothetical protein [Verminephrobacter eiseniae]MCW5302061.1 hypothetical protein [Verminephrobacter eiseniae]MCW8191012.1 hypothetical protein [Verminephrobacter eiseniae]